LEHALKKEKKKVQNLENKYSPEKIKIRERRRSLLGKILGYGAATAVAVSAVAGLGYIIHSNWESILEGLKYVGVALGGMGAGALGNIIGVLGAADLMKEYDYWPKKNELITYAGVGGVIGGVGSTLAYHHSLFDGSVVRTIGAGFFSAFIIGGIMGLEVSRRLKK
jgi:hypothetical protein